MRRTHVQAPYRKARALLTQTHTHTPTQTQTQTQTHTDTRARAHTHTHTHKTGGSHARVQNGKFEEGEQGTPTGSHGATATRRDGRGREPQSTHSGSRAVQVRNPHADMHGHRNVRVQMEHFCANERALKRAIEHSRA